MKKYFQLIKNLQGILLVISIITLMVLPLVLAFNQNNISSTTTQTLYTVSHWFLFFVMMIRPLADIFAKNKWIRPLVILRKGTGVMSAAIIVSFILAKLIVDPINYFINIGTLEYWSMTNYALLAHAADLSAILLIVTSNNFSKRILGGWWKKIQKLSYIYFYGSVLYVFLTYGNIDLLIAMILVTTITLIAFIKNRQKLTQITV